MWHHLSSSFKLRKIGSWNKTVIPSIWQSEWEKQKSRCSDLNLIKMLWWVLKRALLKWIPSNFSEMKQCSKEEWAKSLWSWLTSTGKVFQVIVAKSGSTYYWNIECTGSPPTQLMNVDLLLRKNYFVLNSVVRLFFFFLSFFKSFSL